MSKIPPTRSARVAAKRRAALYAALRLSVGGDGQSVGMIRHPVPIRTAGGVLMVFASGHPQYEVEFVDSAGESLAVLTVNEEDLELVQRMTH